MIRIEGNKIALYQWDVNQRLILSGISAGIEVHYSHNDDVDDECPFTLTYEENGNIYSNIPNILLQKKRYNCSIYLC